MITTKAITTDAITAVLSDCHTAIPAYRAALLPHFTSTQLTA